MAVLCVSMLALRSRGQPLVRELLRPPPVGPIVSPSNLQAALDSAQPGDVLTLQAGATYTGPFYLSRKSGDQMIVLQSSAVNVLPREGTRVDSSMAERMPRLVSPSGAVLTAEAGAHHYRFVGLEIAPSSGSFLLNLVLLGSSESTVEEVPHDFVIERCYLHGDPRVGSRRGIALNSASTIVRDSYFADFKEVGADSQAIAGWNGPGPFDIRNNYIEGAGENILFGGADPAIPNLVPADIQIRYNHLVKPLSWRIGSRQYAGVPWTVKNLLELKNARRVRIEGNTIEHNWVQAQTGFGILFTVRNQDGRAPWSTVEDVVFTNNLVQHVGGAISILGRDDTNPSQQTRRIQVTNNLFLDVSGFWGGGRLFQVLNGTADITFDHNTAWQSETMLFGGDSTPHTGFVFQNNIAPHNLYGIIGSGTGIGESSIERYFPRSVMRRNVIIGGEPSRYPGDNFFPTSMGDVQFANVNTRSRFPLHPFDLRLLLSSRYRNAGTDGSDPGVNIDALLDALSRQ
jgi:hypothetical protein